MGSSYQSIVIIVAKLFNCISTKEKSSSSIWNRPSLYLFRIRPQQITHWPFLGYLFDSVNFFKIFYILYIWRKPSVYTKNLIVHYRS